MARIALRIAALLVLAAGVAAIGLYRRISSLEFERVAGDVHVIYGPRGSIAGLGGNTAVLRTQNGAVVVDTMTFRLQGARIRELAERLGGGPVQVIVNTHYHLDHTHGNPAFPSGSRVVATDATLAYLRGFDADYWTGEAAGTLPNETFASETRLEVGGKTVRCLHPGPGHTGGDLAALFVEDRVLVAGDLFFHGRYPSVDLEAGGSMRRWDAALEQLLALDFERVIPGHGPIGDREALRRFQGFVQQAWRAAAKAASAGQSLEDFLASADVTADRGFEVVSIPLLFRLDREFALRRAWEEATGRARARPLPGVERR
jgi:cyclase